MNFWVKIIPGSTFEEKIIPGSTFEEKVIIGSTFEEKILRGWNEKKSSLPPYLPACLHQSQFVWFLFFKSFWEKQSKSLLFFWQLLTENDRTNFFCMKFALQTKRANPCTAISFLDQIQASTFSVKPQRDKSSKPSNCWGCSGNIPTPKKHYWWNMMLFSDRSRQSIESRSWRLFLTVSSYHWRMSSISCSSTSSFKWADHLAPS